MSHVQLHMITYITAYLSNEMTTGVFSRANSHRRCRYILWKLCASVIVLDVILGIVVKSYFSAVGFSIGASASAGDAVGNLIAAADQDGVSSPDCNEPQWRCSTHRTESVDRLLLRDSTATARKNDLYESLMAAARVFAALPVTDCCFSGWRRR